MKISAKTEYACIAVMELAAHYKSDKEGEPIRIRNIADRHSVPPRFLVQILLQLKGAGIVTSTRGASGGYNLKTSPEEITLGQVMRIIEGQSTGKRTPPPGLAGSNAIKVLNDAWGAADEKRHEYLDSITFAQLVRMVGEMPPEAPQPVQAALVQAVPEYQQPISHTVNEPQTAVYE